MNKPKKKKVVSRLGLMAVVSPVLRKDMEEERRSVQAFEELAGEKGEG